MRFAFTEDQIAFRDAVREFLDKECTPAHLRTAWTDGYLFALSGPIYAGTNEIQRNIIADRVLQLPRASP